MDLVRGRMQRFQWLIVGGLAIGCAFVLYRAATAQGPGDPDLRLLRATNDQPNLAATAPRTADGKPDLSGVWRSASGKYLTNLAADGIQVSFQPWAAALFKERQKADSKDRPSGRCLPSGVPSVMLAREYPWKIVQTPGVILILFDESLHYRQIFTDGRGFPDDAAPSWFGYSIGKWDGDTLVAETVGLNEDTWIDDGGHPHSSAMRVIERFRRRDVGMMDVDITIDDPKTYVKPWTATVRFELLPGTDLSEHVCAVHSTP